MIEDLAAIRIISWIFLWRWGVCGSLCAAVPARRMRLCVVSHTPTSASPLWFAWLPQKQSAGCHRAGGRRKTDLPCPTLQTNTPSDSYQPKDLTRKLPNERPQTNVRKRQMPNECAQAKDPKRTFPSDKTPGVNVQQKIPRGSYRAKVSGWKLQSEMFLNNLDRVTLGNCRCLN